MKGDFSRDTFNVNKNFSGVLMQQGRLLLDADWNEQSAIVLHYLRTLAMDLIGRHGGPGKGFAIDFNGGGDPDLIIERGRYYVDGIPCENAGTLNGDPVSYYNQPYYKNPADLPDTFPFLVYLDVWERHVTCFEDESLCEAALGGIDTTTRAQIVWQVKWLGIDEGEAENACRNIPFSNETRAGLIADIPSVKSYDDPCNIEPDAKYRGLENQLYRVEIHTGNEDGEGIPTFKWSRENGSVLFPIISLSDNNVTTQVQLANLGRDDKFTLHKGDFVEIVDDGYTFQNGAESLLEVIDIDRDEMRVTLNGVTDISADENNKNHPLLRRWDHKAGNPQDGGLTLESDNAAKIIEGEGAQNWLKLEDGIIIQFQKSGDETQPSIYHTGDYWLIPARTATGDIEWTTDKEGNPQPQPPRGIEHHYAPLGIVTAAGIDPCRCEIIPPCPQRPRIGGGEMIVRPSAAEEKSANPAVLEKAVKPAAAKKAFKPKKQKTPK